MRSLHALTALAVVMIGLRRSATERPAVGGMPAGGGTFSGPRPVRSTLASAASALNSGGLGAGPPRTEDLSPEGL
jgi:hypothetical protein